MAWWGPANGAGRAIYGADPYEGEILFKGKKLQPAPDKAIAAGIALVPEERRSQGLFTILTIRSNVPVMNMGKVSRGGFINDATERKITLEYVDKLKIATNTIEKEAAKLSGGNQQKVVLSKCSSPMPICSCWMSRRAASTWVPRARSTT